MAITDATGDQGNNGAWPPTATPASGGSAGGDGVWTDAQGNVHFGTADTGGGITYTGYTSPDGPYGSVYPPGTLYTVGSNGSISVDYTPPKASSGGGGSGAVSVSLNPNSVSAWSRITDPNTGDVYNYNELTGEKQLVFKGAGGTTGQDPSGYDPRTGLPYGVIRDSNSPSGYLYQGQAVNADGSLYSGSGAMGNDAKTWTGYGPKGQGTYYLDGPNGTPGTYIGATTASAAGGPGSMASGGGGGYSVLGPTVSQLSSPASSAAAEQAAQYAQQTQMQKDSQAFTASQNALDRAQRDAQFQANYGLSVQQFQAQQAKDAAAARLGLIDRYGAAVSDTDQAKLQSLRMALGNGTGDVSLVDLLRNAGPGAFQANEAAAALLGEIRGQPASPTGTGMAPVTTPAGATGATGATPATGTGMTPVTTPTGTPVEARTPMGPSMWGGDQTSRDNNSAITAWYDPKNWVEAPSTDITNNMRYMKSTITGETLPIGVWSSVMQDNMGASQQETQRANFWQGASNVSGYPMGDYTGAALVGSKYAGLGLTNVADIQRPSTAPQTGAGAFTPGMSYGNDNVSNPMPTGNLANDNIMRQLPTQTQAVLPMLAHGTERPQMGPIVTGDPQVPGQPNPELTVWTPQGNIVRPLNQMHPMMRPVMGGLPHAAFGTNSFKAAQDARFASWAASSAPTTPTPVAPITDPRTSTSGAIASPYANPSTPGMQTPTSGTSSGAVASPYANPTTPAGAIPASTTGQTSYTPMTPLTAPSMSPTGQQSATVPTSSYPNTGTMQPVTQPQPTTVGGTTVSTTPTPNPADPLALTPQSTQYINDVADFRTNLQYPHLNQLDVSWGRLAPSLQQSNMQGVQTATGIPIADQQFWQNRFAFAGRPTMNAVAGY